LQDVQESSNLSPYLGLTSAAGSNAHMLEVERSTNENREPKTKFTCDFCSRHFVTKQGLQRHLVNSHDTSTMPFECGECEKKFTLKKELEEHLKTTTHPKDFKNRDYACGFCRQKFFTEDSREDHWQTHYENPKPHSSTWKYFVHTCNDCGKKFSSIEFCMGHVRRRHENSETSRKLLGCKFCEKRFCLEQSLVWHTEFHKEIEEKPFECKICEIRFETKKELNEHFVTDNAPVSRVWRFKGQTRCQKIT